MLEKGSSSIRASVCPVLKFRNPTLLQEIGKKEVWRICMKYNASVAIKELGLVELDIGGLELSSGS